MRIIIRIKKVKWWYWSRVSSVSIETGLLAGRRGFNSWQGQWWDFFLRHRVQTGSRAYLASYPMGTGGVKRPGREVVCLPPSSAEVKNAWSYTSTPPYCMAWCLVKHRDFTLPYLFGQSLCQRMSCLFCRWVPCQRCMPLRHGPILF